MIFISNPEMFFLKSEQQPKRVGSFLLSVCMAKQPVSWPESEDRKVSKSRRGTNGRISVWQDAGDFLSKMMFIPI